MSASLHVSVYVLNSLDDLDDKVTSGVNFNHVDEDGCQVSPP